MVDSCPRAARDRFERSALAMAKDGSDAEPTQFVKLPDPTTGAFVEADVRSYLKKWDLAGNSRVHRFRYTRPFHRMDPEPFLRDFFNSDVVREHFEVVDAKGQWCALTDAARFSVCQPCPDIAAGESVARRPDKPRRRLGRRHRKRPCVRACSAKGAESAG